MEAVQKPRKSAVKFPIPPEELKKLQLFAGKWMIEGQILSGAPFSQNTEVMGVHTYDWLSGNFFLVGKWDSQFGNAEHIGISMFGYDVGKQQFFITYYDNLGNVRSCDVTYFRHIWKFAGNKERATIVFSEDEQTFIEDWEIQKDGVKWEPLCSFRGKKIK